MSSHSYSSYFIFIVFVFYSLHQNTDINVLKIRIWRYVQIVKTNKQKKHPY